MITLQHVYWLAWLYLPAVSALSARDRTDPRRWLTGLFWGLRAISLRVGERLPPALMGAWC